VAAAKSAAAAAAAPGFCPAALFSGEAGAVGAALAAALAGGRVRVFLDGVAVEGDRAGALDVNAAWAGGASGVLAATVAVLTVGAPSALAHLLTAQAPPPACPSAAAAAAALETAVAGVEAGKGVPEASATALRAHLRAAAARDASVMVTLAPADARDARDAVAPQASLSAGGALPASGGAHPALRFRLALVDLDAKPVAKVRSHAASDAALAAVVNEWGERESREREG